MADKVKGVEIDPVREKLARLLEDALDYSRMCRDIKRIVGGEEENPFKTAVDYLVSNGATVQEWISVKDRLPEDDPTVKKHIAGERFGFLTVLVYNGVVKETNRFFSNEPRYGLPKTNGWEWASSNVTHWMPLPEPPKGE